MGKSSLLRIAFLLTGMVLVVTDVVLSRRRRGSPNCTQWVLGFLAGINIVFVIYLFFNHANFPLNLNILDGTILQHFRRAVELKAIYPEPMPEYVPMAYNPLFYVLSVPFAWIFGTNLFTLRLVAVLGMLGCGLLLFFIVREKTGSMWWSLVTVGLFAAAYRVMDASLDSGHADSWFLFAVLLGSYVMDRNRSRAWNLVGVVILVAAFWFKQHAALFALGGLLFLTWREGLKRSWLYWLVALVLGPVLYVFAGPQLFGTRFLYFTWEVPRRWMELDLSTLRHFLGFTLKSYPILALAGGLFTIWIYLRKRESYDIWHFQFMFAVLSGFMGALDPGSSNNVFIPMGTWFILIGAQGLRELAIQSLVARHYGIQWLGLFATFALFLYNPLTVTVSRNSQESYADLVGMLQSLDGTVYAPSLGQLQSGYVLYPAAHWAALEDMIRGPGRDTRNNPNTRRLLEPALSPSGPAYILANYPLQIYPWMAFLGHYYVLETDFGDRFKPLRVLPCRWDHGWPRYLYRYIPPNTAMGPLPDH